MAIKQMVILTLLAAACAPKPNDEDSKSAVMQAEKDFAAMAKEKGTASAFYEFAANDAVIKRGSQLIRGREAIKEFYSKQSGRGVLQWAPDFADVSGDIGYTYGKFTFTDKDSTGKPLQVDGYFHTVWKRQKDGTWKFVWD